MNNTTFIPIQSSIKYLGMTLDKRLTWSHHYTKLKHKGANTRLHLVCPILKSKISLANKLILHKNVMPVWSYRIQIWGPVETLNIRPLQALSSMFLSP